MKTEEKIELVEILACNKREFDRLIDGLEIVFGSVDVGGGLFLCVETQFKCNIKLVSMLTGLSQDNLEWFVWENNLGVECMIGRHEGVDYIIKDEEDFVKFEELSNK